MKYVYEFLSINELPYSATYDTDAAILTVYSRSCDIFCTVAKISNHNHVYRVENFMNTEEFIVHVYMRPQGDLYFNVSQHTQVTLSARQVKKA